MLFRKLGLWKQTFVAVRAIVPRTMGMRFNADATYVSIEIESCRVSPFYAV